MNFVFSIILKLLLGIFEPLAKKTKTVWDDYLIKLVRLILNIITLGAFKK